MVEQAGRNPIPDLHARAERVRREYAEAQRDWERADEDLRRAREAYDRLDSSVEDAMHRLNQAFNEFWDAVTATYPLPTP